MESDRTNWGVQEYADALNSAATPADLLELVKEVNRKWAEAGDLERKPTPIEASAPAR